MEFSAFAARLILISFTMWTVSLAIEGIYMIVLHLDRLRVWFRSRKR